MIKNRYYNLNLSIYVVFLLLFIIGLITYKDYGVGIDDKFHRLNGFYWLNYILSFTNFDDLKNLVDVKLNAISDYSLPSVEKYNKYSIIFDVPAAMLELFLKIDNPKEYYEIRHFLNFLVFFIGCIFFYKLLNLRFDKVIAFFGTCLFILSPRIYGESFYNMKDIIYLTFLIISYYYCFKSFINFNLKNLIPLALFTALCIQTRILGLSIPISFLFFFFLSVLSVPKDIKHLNKLGLYFLSLIIFTIIFWPYLWSSPVSNFISTFNNWVPSIYILFNGNYILNDFLPYSYIPVWILISCPIFHLLLFFFGTYELSKKIFKKIINVEKKSQNYDFWKDNYEKFDLFIFLNFFILMILVIFLNIRLFNAWKHLYFVNFFLIYLASFGLNTIYSNFKKLKKLNIFNISLIFILSFTTYEMYKYHPYQGLYFNFLIPDETKKKFEIDFTALSSKHFFNEIFQLEKGKAINIANASWTPLIRTLDIFEKDKKERVTLVGQNYQKAEYIYTNHISEVDKRFNDKYDIPSNFFKLYEYKINGTLLYTVYKKK